MKTIIQSMAAGCIFLAATTAQADPQSAVFLVIENGGVVTDRDAAKITTDFVLGEIVKLRRRRATRDTQIHLVLSKLIVIADDTPTKVEAACKDLFSIMNVPSLALRGALDHSKLGQLFGSHTGGRGGISAVYLERRTTPRKARADLFRGDDFGNAGAYELP